MELNRVTIEDYESIIAFYDDVTDRTPYMEQYARWKKGLHPTHDGIRAYIEEGSMYTYKENDVIIGAMAVTMYQGEDYHAIEWVQQVEDNEAAVIHNSLGFEYRGKQHLYAENTGWTDFYFFEYNEVTHIRFIEKEKWNEALKLVKEVFMEFEAPDYCEEGIADFMHAIGDESYLSMHRFYGAYDASPYGHGFYKKLGFVDTSEEQITNGVRYFPMKK